jgi:hypothetical protein
VYKSRIMILTNERIIDPVIFQQENKDMMAYMQPGGA